MTIVSQPSRCNPLEQSNCGRSSEKLLWCITTLPRSKCARMDYTQERAVVHEDVAVQFVDVMGSTLRFTMRCILQWIFSAGSSAQPNKRGSIPSDLTIRAFLSSRASCRIVVPLALA